MKASLHAIWRWLKWPILIVVFLYCVLVGWRVFWLFEEEKTAESVAAIHAQKITLADVMGENLPPVPDQAQNDATVAGIDSNNNGIRDDVELAIFRKYPNSPKVRAAQLQYASAIQLMLTKVYNSETWVAAAKQDTRAYLCIGETYPRTNFQKYLQITEERSEEVEDLVIDTPSRQRAEDAAYEFTTSYGSDEADACDIALETV